MRKTLLVLLLVAAVLSSAFAAKDSSVMLGLSSGYSQMISFSDSEYIENTTTEIVPVKADALFYLGDSFALNAALGLDIFLPEIDGADAQTGFVADILAYYRLKAGDSFSLLIGGGTSYRYMGLNEEVLGVTGTVSYHSLALLASLRLQFDISDHISAFAGADAGYNVWNANGVSYESEHISGSDVKPYDANIMPWAVKAGINYRF